MTPKRFHARLALTTLLALLTIQTAWAAADQGLRTRPAEWAQPLIGGGPGNLYQVSPEVYRSEQPDAGDLRELAGIGLRSVLNLREYHSDADEAEGTPLALHHVAMNAGEIDDEVIIRALQALAIAPKPVLVHCWHGSDRTGVVIAMYRMVFQGWPRERAIDEFVNGGYGYHRGVFPGIEGYLRQVDVGRIRDAVQGAGSPVSP